MSDSTKIEWAHATWNPWEGCTKVSPGCAHCYAEARNLRFAGGVNWGKGAPRRRTAKANWSKPLRWNTEVEAHPDYRHRVFPSLCDWLDAEVPIEWLADFLNLINKTPNLDWLLLTKRPENWKPQLARALTCCMTHGVVTDGRFAAAKMVEAWLNGTPPANVWIGTSIEDQKRADERIPELLKIPARVRFLSVEPLLGPVELTGLRCGSCGYSKADMQRHMDHHICKNPTQLIAWTIIGGESGPKARPCNIEWIRSIVEQCKSAAVPCFVKQLGSQVVSHGITGPGQHWPQGSIKTEVEVKVEPMKGEVVWLHGLKHSKGGDQIEWPKDLRVRQFPEVTS